MKSSFVLGTKHIRAMKLCFLKTPVYDKREADLIREVMEIDSNLVSIFEVDEGTSNENKETIFFAELTNAGKEIINRLERGEHND